MSAARLDPSLKCGISLTMAKEKKNSERSKRFSWKEDGLEGREEDEIKKNLDFNKYNVGLPRTNSTVIYRFKYFLKQTKC